MVSHPRWRCLPPTSLSRSIVNSAGAYIRVGGDSRSYLHCHPPSHNLPNIMSDFVLGRVANQPVVPGEVDLRRCPLSNGSYLHWLAADLSFGYRPRSCRSAKRPRCGYSWKAAEGARAERPLSLVAHLRAERRSRLKSGAPPPVVQALRVAGRGNWQPGAIHWHSADGSTAPMAEKSSLEDQWEQIRTQLHRPLSWRCVGLVWSQSRCGLVGKQTDLLPPSSLKEHTSPHCDLRLSSRLEFRHWGWIVLRI